MTQGATRSSRLLRNTLSNAVGRVVAIATMFALTPYILESLGETAFGIWALANVVVSYGSLLELGVGSAVIKYVADAQARQDMEAAHRVLGTSTRLYTGLALVALLAGALVSTQATHLIDLGPSAQSTTTAVLAITTASFAINLAGTPAAATLRGLQRYEVTNAIKIANVLTTAAFTVLVLQRGGDLVAMVAITVPISLVTQVITVFLVGKLYPDFALRWSPASRSTARNLTGFGLTLTVSQVAVLLQKRTSEIIIASAMTVAAVTPYSLARRLSEVPHVISDQFLKVLLPVASELHATGASSALQRLYLASARITFAIMLPLALCIAFLAGDLLELWVGRQYRDSAILVVVLVAASVAFTSQWPAGAVFQGMGRFGPFAVAALVSGTANVLLTLVLIGPYGLTGVVIGTLVPTLAEAFLFALPYTLVRLKIPLGAFVKQAFLPALLPVIPCVVILVIAGWMIDAPSWPALIITGALAVAAYESTYLLAPIADRERALVGGLVRRLARRRG